MNTGLNGQISYEEFHTFCSTHPPAMDFLCRMTVCQGGFMMYPSPQDGGQNVEQILQWQNNIDAANKSLSNSKSGVLDNHQLQEVANNRNMNQVYNNFKIEAMKGKSHV